jgi:hypothetical protein
VDQLRPAEIVLRAYRSIFLEPDWAHTHYYGWKEEARSPGVRVLRKVVGPASRRLVLSECGADEVNELVGNSQGLLAETIVHDFSGTLSTWQLPGFKALPRDGWMLNGGTFAIDLAEDATAIFEAMTPDTKRRIRKAEKAGIEVAVEHHPNPSRLERFFAALQQMHRERGLYPVPVATLSRMFEDGRATLLSNEAADSPGAYLMLYRAGPTAIWLHGVGRGATADTGQLLQWRAIAALKAAGAGWYDLGGAPADAESGIYRYKQAFGGAFVSLGNEWVRTSSAVAVARHASLAMRRFKS